MSYNIYYHSYSKHFISANIFKPLFSSHVSIFKLFKQLFSDSASIFKQLFTFLEPYAELRSQSDVFVTDKSNSNPAAQKKLPQKKIAIGEESALSGWWWY